MNYTRCSNLHDRHTEGEGSMETHLWCMSHGKMTSKCCSRWNRRKFHWVVTYWARSRPQVMPRCQRNYTLDRKTIVVLARCWHTQYPSIWTCGSDLWGTRDTWRDPNCVLEKWRELVRWCWCFLGRRRHLQKENIKNKVEFLCTMGNSLKAADESML